MKYVQFKLLFLILNLLTSVIFVSEYMTESLHGYFDILQNLSNS